MKIREEWLAVMENLFRYSALFRIYIFRVSSLESRLYAGYVSIFGKYYGYEFFIIHILFMCRLKTVQTG